MSETNKAFGYIGHKEAGTLLRTKPLKVIVVDDHDIVRRGLVSVLCLEGDIEVVGAASGLSEAMKILETTYVDVAIVDLNLDGSVSSGMELCSAICSSESNPKVVVFSAALSPQLVAEAVSHGASGYVSKETDVAQLADTLRCVVRGEPGFDAAAGSLLLGTLSHRAPMSLSEREAEIVALVAKGLTNSQIGRETYLSPSTIKYHLANIAKKLGVGNRAEIVFAAAKAGLI